jgi:hypothetical protein
MNWSVVLATCPLAAMITGLVIWAVQRQAAQVSKAELGQDKRDADDVRHRLLEDEERVRRLIAGELARFQIEFLKTLNGTYVRTGEMDQMNLRFTSLENLIKGLPRQA